ncbi:proton channel OTOP3-like isoform X3 [Tachysurus fulvidraco]|uniref:proton channel OTOP3-like isoform X3 n=1 Tax=Tachysurus fulvidraco TaxID=1234273 RepID=UPI001FEF8E96|nr:proton channel OTOP3-like isoform X3 [Tachysurus fulvidraco]
MKAETEELELKVVDLDLKGLENNVKSSMDSEGDVNTDEAVWLWVPTGRRLISGLFGINVVLLGAALVAGDTLNPVGLHHHEPEVFLLLLMGISVVWMLWYLLWSRRQPGAPPHTDHHAGGITITVVLMLFAGFSLLLLVFMIAYAVLMMECLPAAKVLLPFVQTPFLILQTYLLWSHSKDCIHKHKVLTRAGLMIILCTDVLLWLNAVTEDTIHMELELERQYNETISGLKSDEDSENATECECRRQPACIALRKGYEVLYPFNMEFSLLASCMLYVMWKNVGRHTIRTHSGHAQKFTLRILCHSGILLGLILGVLVLISGIVVFLLYQVWMGQKDLRQEAFLMFYSFHICVIPTMVLCSLAGTLVYRWKESHGHSQHQGRDTNGGGGVAKAGGGVSKNPTRSLDVLLLLGAGLGQLSLSYFSLVAALALGAGGILGNLHLTYSLLSLLELILQNIFIIQALHSQLYTHSHSHSYSIKSQVDGVRAEEELFQKMVRKEESKDGGRVFLHHKHDAHHWSKRIIQEICTYLILCNVMVREKGLWVIPAFGAHPQFESAVGKQFFGLSVWFVLVNLGQPLTVFYRMHSVGALMELLIAA